MADQLYTLWPGSAAAQLVGCTCPVLDNGHGNVEAARARGGWWKDSACPVHGLDGYAPAVVPQREGTVLS